MKKPAKTDIKKKPARKSDNKNKLLDNKGKSATLTSKTLNPTKKKQADKVAADARQRAKDKALGVDRLKPYQFKKGVVYNPNGAKVKEKNLSRLLEDIMDEPAVNVPLICQICNHLGLDPKETTIGAVLAASLVAKGCKGDVNAIKEIFNRVEGRVAVRVEMVDPGEIVDGISYEDLMERAKDAIKRSTKA